MDEQWNQRREKEQEEDNSRPRRWCGNCGVSCVIDNCHHAYARHLCGSCSQGRCCRSCIICPMCVVRMSSITPVGCAFFGLTFLNVCCCCCCCWRSIFYWFRSSANLLVVVFCCRLAWTEFSEGTVIAEATRWVEGLSRSTWTLRKSRTRLSNYSSIWRQTSMNQSIKIYFLSNRNITVYTVYASAQKAAREAYAH